MTVSANVMYSYLLASLGAIDHEKGYKWQGTMRGTYVRRTFHPLFQGLFDVGVPLPLPHSSVWLRMAGGYSPGEKFEPFANFFFGGFGNNWIDWQTEKRYRQYYAFPGIELNHIAGTNFGKGLLEWNLPPLRFRHIGTTSFYMTWARVSLLGSGIITNFDDTVWRREVGNVGAQLDLRMMLLSRLRLTFSTGYALAFEKGFGPSEEFMLSVKVL
jgi:hypothetical protein